MRVRSRSPFEEWSAPLDQLFAPSRAVESWVVNAEVDVGFVTSEPRRPELSVRRLFAEEIVLVVEPKAAGRQPLALEELGLILFPKSTGFRQYIDQRLGLRQLSVSVKMETDSVEAIKSFVTVGIGASFLPISTVREELRQATLARVQARGLGKLERRTSLIWRRDRAPGVAMQSFLGIVSPVGMARSPSRGRGEVASSGQRATARGGAAGTSGRKPPDDGLGRAR
jgi:DNA-binding transcriptional LysR family regulator